MGQHSVRTAGWLASLVLVVAVALGAVLFATGGTAQAASETLPAELQITATKEFVGEGVELKAGDFEFVLKQGNTTLQTKSNDANGNIEFDAIPITRAGTYTYTVSEVKPADPDPNITYSSEVKQIRVTATTEKKGSDSRIVISKITPGATSQENVGESTEGSAAELPQSGYGTKANLSLKNSKGGTTGVEISLDNQVAFCLEHNKNYPKGESYSRLEKDPFSASQEASLKAIGYWGYPNDGGNYLSTLQGLYGTTKGKELFSYATSMAVWQVMDPNYGPVSGSYYRSNSSASQDQKAAETIMEWIFEQGGVPAGVDVKLATYQTGGSSYQKLILFSVGEGSVTQQRTVVTTTAFVNTYEKPVVFNTPTKLRFVANKELNGEGASLKADQFTFTITDKDGNTRTRGNKADGSIDFGEFTYNAAGTYTYTIKEVKGIDSTIKFDLDPRTVKVEVALDEDNHLKVVNVEGANWPEGSASADIGDFTNEYTKPEDAVDITIKTKKYLTGATLEEGQFEFELTGPGIEEDPIRATNDAAGNIVFPTFKYTLEDFKQMIRARGDNPDDPEVLNSAYEPRSYTIKEVPGKAKGYEYDSKTFDVHFMINHIDENPWGGDKGLVIWDINTIDPNSEDNHYFKSISFDLPAVDGSDDRTFTNTYTTPQVEPAKATITASKFLISEKPLEAGQFEFTLTDASGNVVEIVKNDENGNIAFSPIEFTEAGEYTYEVREGVVPASIKADGEVLSVTFNVTERDGKLYVNNREEITRNIGSFVNIERSIGTSAATPDGSKVVFAGGSVTIVDTVTYENLEVGTEYTLKGELINKITEEVVATAEKTFKPETEDGTVELEFTFEPADAGDYVVFETLYDAKGEFVAEHKDPNDRDQTVEVIKPTIGTTAVNANFDADADYDFDENAEDAGFGPDKILSESAGQVVKDAVAYRNLEPGKEYTLTGQLVVKATGDVLDEITVTFTPASANGYQIVEFNEIDALALGGKELVVFEYLTLADGTPVAEHADLDDQGQTVYVEEPETPNPDKPTAHTTATDAADGDKTIEAAPAQQVRDVVKYTNLVPGKEYTLEGRLVTKSSNGRTVVDTKTVKFTPEAKDGEVELVFEVDASALAGEKLVAFETVKDGRTMVAIHADINDADQTVDVEEPNPDKPTVKEGKIGTTVEGASDSAAANLSAEEAATKTSLVDVIDYEGLVPGATYTVSGRLMENGTTEVATATAQCVASDTGSGSWEITFEFAAGTLKPNTKYVVFEKAESSDDANGPYVHEDADDVSQTIVVGPQPTPTSGTLATNVDALGYQAPADYYLKLQNADLEGLNTVTDHITYGGLTPNATYTVTGTLMKVADGQATPVEGATATAEYTASESGSGVWDMTFENVNLEQDAHYVVFEEAKKIENEEVIETIEHRNVNDMAQTLVVGDGEDELIIVPGNRPYTPTRDGGDDGDDGGKDNPGNPNRTPTTPTPTARPTTPNVVRSLSRTADELGPAVYGLGALAIVAFSAGAVALHRKRKEDK